MCLGAVSQSQEFADYLLPAAAEPDIHIYLVLLLEHRGGGGVPPDQKSGRIVLRFEVGMGVPEEAEQLRVQQRDRGPRLLRKDHHPGAHELLVPEVLLDPGKTVCALLTMDTGSVQNGKVCSPQLQNVPYLALPPDDNITRCVSSLIGKHRDSGRRNGFLPFLQ